MHILRNEGMLTPNAIYEIFYQSKGKFDVALEAYIHWNDKEENPILWRKHSRCQWHQGKEI